MIREKSPNMEKEMVRSEVDTIFHYLNKIHSEIHCFMSLFTEPINNQKILSFFFPIYCSQQITENTTAKQREIYY